MICIVGLLALAVDFYHPVHNYSLIAGVTLCSALIGLILTYTRGHR